MKVKETKNKVVFIGILVRMSPEKGVLIISVNYDLFRCFFPPYSLPVFESGTIVKCIGCIVPSNNKEAPTCIQIDEMEECNK